ncbi:MAG: outer membrane beta-barrel protein [Capsulimonadaceae bacterium]|nr:outer membrane beta-barrel protein [Capsulimonadaceae bacterium]
MKKIAACIVIGVLTLSTYAVANADEQVQKPWTLQTGASWPGQNTAKNNVEGKTVWNVGVDYAFLQAKTLSSSEPTIVSVYFDYAGGSKDKYGYSNHAYTSGGGIAARQYLDPTAATSPYIGAGIGGYDTQSKYLGSSKSRFNIGGKVFAGLEFTKSYFLQVGYEWLPSVNHVDPSNLGVDVGLRF